MHDLREDRAELVDDDVDGVDALRQELLREEPRDLAGVRVLELAEDARVRLLGERILAPLPVLDGLLPDREQADFRPLRVRGDQVRRRADDVRVERAARPRSPDDHDDDDPFLLALRRSGMLNVRRLAPVTRREDLRRGGFA